MAGRLPLESRAWSNESDQGAIDTNTTALIGTAATVYGVGAALAALLQARQLLRRRSSCDVSAGFFGTYVGGYALWLLYGLSVGSVPLIVVDLVGLVCGGVTLAVALRLRGSMLRPSTWNTCPVP